MTYGLPCQEAGGPFSHLPRELPGAVVGACTCSRRISRATREALLPVEVDRFSFHRICLNLKIWNRLMGRFEYTPVDCFVMADLNTSKVQVIWVPNAI